jgi:hypothetical protein
MTVTGELEELPGRAVGVAPPSPPSSPTGGGTAGGKVLKSAFMWKKGEIELIPIFLSLFFF